MMESNRRNWLMKTGMAFAGLGLGKLALFGTPLQSDDKDSKKDERKQPDNPNDFLKLGAFSISLTVKDIVASIEFYKIIGFTIFAGSIEQRYVVMKSEDTLIGLFQGMFEKNMLTFNPGWNTDAKNIEKFDDVRDIQKRLKSKGIPLLLEVDENAKGPGSFLVADPDGNPILFDQHV